jgi:hypothetical protein
LPYPYGRMAAGQEDDAGEIKSGIKIKEIRPKKRVC